MTKYKTIDTGTLDGLRQAERLQARGWRVVRSGLFVVWMEKREDR